MRLTRFLPLLLAPLLTACVDDRVAYEVPGGNEIITLIREQPWPWDKSVNVSLVVARMPDCMRRHEVGKSVAGMAVELFEYEPTTYVLRMGGKMWVTETRTCEGFAPMNDEPAQGIGRRLGIWQPKNGVLEWVPEK